MAQGLFVIDSVPWAEGVGWWTELTKAAGVDCLIEETLGNVGIAVGTSDCFLMIHRALEMRFVLRITGKIGVVLEREMSLGPFVMGLNGKL